MMRSRAHLGLGLFAVVVFAVVANAVGISFAIPVETLDLSEALARVPTAAGMAFDVLDQALASYGVPSEDRDALRTGFEDGLDTVEEEISRVPTVIPLPYLGGGIEIGVPLPVIDSVSFSGGWLSDALFRWAADVAGWPIPSPLIEVPFDDGGLDGSVRADVTFSSWTARAAVTARLDALFVALRLGLGLQASGGGLRPQIEVDVPRELEEGVNGALNALHVDGLTWSRVGVLGSVALELGPPFFRLTVGAQAVLPLAESSGWWGLRMARFGGSVGMVIRF